MCHYKLYYKSKNMKTEDTMSDMQFLIDKKAKIVK